MKKRYSVVQAKEIPGRDKPTWLRHGIAFENEKGLRIKLESLPLPNSDGDVWLSLFEDNGSRPDQGGQAQSNSFQAPASDGLDDDIPF